MTGRRRPRALDPAPLSPALATTARCYTAAPSPRRWCYPARHVEITGEFTTYLVVAGSGQMVSCGFRAIRGAPALGLPGIASDLMAVTAGPPDDQSRFKPQLNDCQSKGLAMAPCR